MSSPETQPYSPPSANIATSATQNPLPIVAIRTLWILLLLVSILSIIVLIVGIAFPTGGYNDLGQYSASDNSRTAKAILGFTMMFSGFASIGLFIAALVCGCVAMYRMWTALPLTTTDPTPGQAVGFLFIPFFNWYWIFKAYAGWATQYNRFAQHIGISHRVSEGLFIAFAVCTLGYFTIGMWIPFFNLMFPFVVGILCVSVYSQANRALQAIPADAKAAVTAQMQAAAPVPQAPAHTPANHTPANPSPGYAEPHPAPGQTPGHTQDPTPSQKSGPTIKDNPYLQ